MFTENLSTLKIHKLTQAQYDRELAAGNLDENAIYLTPEEEVDFSNYQSKADNALETESKEIVGAINEINTKTIDKIATIDTWYDGACSFESSTEGLSWEDKFALFDEEENELKTGKILHRVPIVAGENVDFTYDENNQVIKINATGGSNTGGSLPSCDSTNEGQFLRVVNGVPAWSVVHIGEEATF